jgi:hypothetical protein
LSLPRRTFAKLDLPTPVLPRTTILGLGKLDSFGTETTTTKKTYLTFSREKNANLKIIK